jgi:hypothetical protein
MPGRTGSTGECPVVPVGINPAGDCALVLRVFVLAVVSVVDRWYRLLTGGTGESPVVPVSLFPAKCIFT